MGQDLGAPPAESLPRHVAVIMDGNGRWARRRLLPRIEGHRAGVKSVRMIVEESRRLGIRYLTLYAFSTENWQRPREEVTMLMKLFAQYLESELELMLKHDIRLRAIGDLKRLPNEVQQALQRNMERTKGARAMDLILAVSYGGREEITQAARVIAQKVKNGELSPADISERTIAGHLYAPDVPDPDVLIRTSDENRISNFLLWQLAYAEIVLTPLLWPEFTVEEYHRCLRAFAGRVRRFGLTDEQLDASSTAAVRT